MKVSIITTGLKVGGAETVLLNIVKELLKSNLKINILSLSDTCYLDKSFKDLGVDVKNYNLKSPTNFLRGLLTLCKDLRKTNPKIVQTWMPHADLIGGIIAKILTSAKIIWACHHADMSLKSLKFPTLVIFRINSILSYLVPDKIVAVSEHVKTQLIKNGFNKRSLIVIENGIDCSIYKFSTSKKNLFSYENGIKPHKNIIGFIGRYSPEKRPQDFIKLASLLTKDSREIHFIMVGEGNEKSNKELTDLITLNNLTDKITLLGIRKDLPAIFSSLDLVVSTSEDEAFGMILIEALSCGCPCISTNNAGAISVGKEYIKYADVGDITTFYSLVNDVLVLSNQEINLFRQEASKYAQSRFSIQTTANSYLKIYGL